MKRFIKRARGYFKMKFEMLVWRLYDKCADYLDKHSLVDRVDSDKYHELEDKYYELEDKCMELEKKSLVKDAQITYMMELLEEEEEGLHEEED